MMNLEAGAATAAHWSGKDYDQLFKPGAPRRVALVIEDGGQPQGFLVARAIAAEWEIENIAVAGRAQRRALATRLLGEFLDQARKQGAQSVFLEVRQSNQAARALYKKWAFMEGGRRKDYYRHPQEDAIVYQLRFA